MSALSNYQSIAGSQGRAKEAVKSGSHLLNVVYMFPVYQLKEISQSWLAVMYRVLAKQILYLPWNIKTVMI